MKNVKLGDMEDRMRKSNVYLLITKDKNGEEALFKKLKPDYFLEWKER